MSEPGFPRKRARSTTARADARGIIGQATPDEAQALLEEGIEIAALPVLPDDVNYALVGAVGSIDEMVASSDEARLLGQQEADQCCYFLRRAASTHRLQRLHASAACNIGDALTKAAFRSSRARPH